MLHPQCKEVMSKEVQLKSTLQDPVVQRMDNTINWINCYPVDKHLTKQTALSTG